MILYSLKHEICLLDETVPYVDCNFPHYLVEIKFAKREVGVC